jgi:hypothetical protein
MLLAQNQGTKASRISLNSISSLNTQWVLDSGATNHITGNKNILENYNAFSTKQCVTVTNGEKIKILGDGSIIIFSKKISNVLFVKDCELMCLYNFQTKRILHQTSCIYTRNKMEHQKEKIDIY